MLAKRIIPCLDVKAGRVVKGVNFVNLTDAGDPVACAEAYDRAGADELTFLDITASSDARRIMLDTVRAVARAVYIPFTVGGGIQSIQDYSDLLHAGAEKVSVNSYAVAHPEILAEAGAQVRLPVRGPGHRRQVERPLLRGLYARRQAPHRHGRRGLGQARRGPGRGGDPADLHGR